MTDYPGWTADGAVGSIERLDFLADHLLGEQPE